MATKAYYPIEEIGKGKPGFSKTRSIIEAAFYGNNVVPVNTLKEAYNLAKNSPGTVVTDMPVYRGEEFGLDADAKVLLFNDGAITGRYATARRIAGEPGVDCDALDKVAMDAIYTSRFKKMYHATVYAGLDPEFMVKAHLLIPEGEENIMYNWMLNFQYMSDEYVKMYKESKAVGDGKEPDIYIFSDPQWIPKEAPGVSFDCLSDPAKKTLCYFNTETNCACILGMRYFGEHKKGTLTMFGQLQTVMDMRPAMADRKNTYFRTEAVMLHLYMDCQDPENQRLHMRSMVVNMRSRYFTTMRLLSIRIHAHPSRSSLPILIRQQTIRQDARTINIF